MLTELNAITDALVIDKARLIPKRKDEERKKSVWLSGSSSLRLVGPITPDHSPNHPQSSQQLLFP